ncbi:dihydropteroate synthase [Leucobacter denitrificans]|uniref:7,8-dihydroneopterin aldolase n=2 Tax=Leucobacter denitrificans TaxID=683042 RepID=A0A7G9S859_9MICO|nr:dihydropteroate synthase [Leucobacter denitrificans]
MGVLNITEDSFSDGGKYLGTEAALEQAQRLVSEGATIIDVGGESTRPGAIPVPREVELARVVPVIETLAADGIAVSIDTFHAETAAAAVRAGARYINDVSGGLHDPQMLSVAAEASRDAQVTYIAGHWRGIPDLAHTRSHYDDVVTDVRSALGDIAAAALAAGVERSKLILDPGLGFDKTGEQCWEILRRLDELQSLGYPVLIGASRKRMISEALAGVVGATPESRDLATSVVSALAARAGAWGVRVHDVAATSAALAIERAWQGESIAATSTTVPAWGQDHIRLTGLEVFAHHGVFDFEREQGQKFLVDADVQVDLRAASANDDLASTVHYGELAEAIVAAVSNDPVDLIETVAERVAEVALSFSAVTEARVTIHKPDAPIEAEFADVSVTVVRHRGAR